MTDDTDNKVASDHAAPTAGRRSPFAEIVVPSLSQQLSRSMSDKWVVPLYSSQVLDDTAKFTSTLRPIFHELDDGLISTLLSELNWRPRMVAAYLAAIGNRRTHEEHIGKLLLRSDVCYAGRGPTKNLWYTRCS